MNVLILGLGQYPKGSGVSAALYFAKQGHSVLATDLKTKEQLKDNVKTLSAFKHVSFHLGGHDAKDIRWADLIVRGPSVRSDSKEMLLARKLGKETTSDLGLFLKHCPCPVIGVTGTRGKSTTTAMIHAILEASGKWRKAWLGGNILISPLTFLSRVKANDIVVLEMSSFQLEALGDAGISPQIAVWTNLMRDHLNMYPSMVEYGEAKAQIFRHQRENDMVFLNSDSFFDSFAEQAPGHVTRVLEQRFRLAILGEHNQINASFAAAVAKYLGIKAADIKKALHAFKGLPNRIEVIAQKGGVTFVNDTTATTPDGARAALECFPMKKGRQIHHIMGGADKELLFEDFSAYLKKRPDVSVYLLAGTAHEKIVQAFTSSKKLYIDCANLDEAFVAIKLAVKKGDIVLLSPACASFGLFKNEYHRGEEFKKRVKRWK